MDRTRPIGIRRISLVTILLFQLSSLLIREYLRMTLASSGFSDRDAANLSALGGLLVFMVLLLPLRRQLTPRLQRALQYPPCWSPVVARGIAIGVTMRLAAWSLMIVQVSLGWASQANEAPATALLFWWQCPPVSSIGLSVITLVIAIPVVEESINRGVILGELRARSVPQAAAVSALVFAVFHVIHTMPIAFLFGLVMARLVTSHHCLWPSMLAHATFNGLVILDWHCLQGLWLPAEPSKLAGLVASGATLGLVTVAWRLARPGVPGPDRPRLPRLH